jgi:hypothetical protein
LKRGAEHPDGKDQQAKTVFHMMVGQGGLGSKFEACRLQYSVAHRRMVLGKAQLTGSAAGLTLVSQDAQDDVGSSTADLAREFLSN